MRLLWRSRWTKEGALGSELKTVSPFRSVRTPTPDPSDSNWDVFSKTGQNPGVTETFRETATPEGDQDDRRRKENLWERTSGVFGIFNEGLWNGRFSRTF